MIKKLTSRKFWLAIISIVMGIMGIFNFSDHEIAATAGYLTALIPTIIYIIMEGKIDLAAIESAANVISKGDELCKEPIITNQTQDGVVSSIQ